MNKTHKTALGFVGLGLVAAITSVAATLPSPAASAVSSVTDTIQLRVIPSSSDLAISSPSGEEIHQPNYDFTASYNGLSHIKIEITRRNADGEIISGPTEIWDTPLDASEGTKDFNLNLNDYGGYGYYTIIATGTDRGGAPIERFLTVNYIKWDGKEEEKGDEGVTPGTGKVDINPEVPYEEVQSVTIEVYDENGDLVWGPHDINNPSSVETLDLSGLPDGTYTGKIISRDEVGNILKINYVTIVIENGDTTVDVNIEQKVDTVTKIEADVYDDDGNLVRKVVADRETGTVYVYDENGNLIDTIAGGYSKETGINIPLVGLEYGDYTVKMSFRNKYNKLVGDIFVYKISYYGEAVPVPDTGSFFRGLNISREDYLLTGLIVFSVVGVVAFSVVARNKKDRKK